LTKISTFYGVLNIVKRPHHKSNFQVNLMAHRLQNFTAILNENFEVH